MDILANYKDYVDFLDNLRHIAGVICFILIYNRYRKTGQQPSKMDLAALMLMFY